MAEKSLVEQALLEAKAITESVKESAKEILPSLLKKEINELIKESIDDVDEIELDSEEIDVTDDMDMDMMGMDMDMGAVELDLTSSSDDEVMKVFKKMGPEDEIEVVKTGDGVTLTDGNEEYEIKNVSEGHHKKDETMYEIELDDDMMEMMDDDMMEEGGSKMGDQSATRSDYKNYKGTDKGYHGNTGSSHGDQSTEDDYMNEMDDMDEMYSKKHQMEMKDEPVYEIELDGEGEEELEEASMARTFAHGSRASSGTRKGTSKSSVIPNKSLAKQNGIKESRRLRNAQPSSRVIKENKMLKGTLSKYGDQVKVLKGKNEEYKKALSLFREKLNEVAVFNSNLAYTTKLFTDHSTTKKEKLNILSRFDEVITLKESKSLYKKINGEVSSKGALPIQEVISKKGGTKVITESSNSVKNNTIRENKVYQDPQMKRMMDLMGKL
tara:strand:+ start:6881 stop:8197 length:1317 start_codon:yes stop_codon:yes gene_type:complete